MGKKIALVVGLLAVIGGLVWWFVLRSDVTPEGQEEITTSSETSPADSGATAANPEGSGQTPTATGTPDGKAAKGPSILPGEEGSATGVDDMEDSDYSEPVDKEDFADFVNAAIEELESDEVMANAIVTEMVKILEAQPALEDEGVRFYRQCMQKTKVAASVKDKCSAELKKRGLE